MKKFLCLISVLVLLGAACLLQVSAVDLVNGDPGALAKEMVFPTDGSTHTAICPVCCKEVSWYAIDAATASAGKSLSNGYHYYLSEDVDASLSNPLISAPSTTAGRCCLHLNGKKLINRSHVSLSGSNGRFNVMGDGIVQGARTGTEEGATLQVNATSEAGILALYGGTYSKVNPGTTANVAAARGNGGTIALYDGATIQAGTAGSAVFLNGTVLYVGTAFRMYGGKVDASTTSEIAIDMQQETKKRINKVEFTMAGGELIVGTGGCVDIKDRGALYMTGGTIRGGSRATGGNISIGAGGKMVMSGGTVLGGQATGNGGNIYVAPGGALEMSGGQIKDGIAAANGGNVCVDQNARFTMSGGKISGTRDESGNALGGKAKNGGNLYVGNNPVTEGTAEFIMTGGTIENGTATTDGGNIYLRGQNNKGTDTKATIQNATITGGKAGTNGGNININRATLTIEEGTEILNGTAGTRAGSVFFYVGKVIMNGGRIAGGTAGSANTDNMFAYGVSNTYPGSIYMLGGVIDSSDDASNTGVVLIAYGRLYLANDATILDKNTAYAAIGVSNSTASNKLVDGKVFICDGWTGSADIYVDAAGYAAGSAVSTNHLQVVTLKDDLTTTTGGSFTGILTQRYKGTGVFIPSATKGQLTVANAVTVADGKITATADPLTDLKEGAYLRLSADMTIADLGGKEIIVDLNGYNLSVGGSGTVKAFDSKNDTYQASLCGKITATGTVKVEKEFVAPNGNRYIALTDSGKISMHRLEMYLTSVSLRTTQAGLYYKATYKCDTAVEQHVASYGVVMSLHNMPGANFTAAIEHGDNNVYTVGKDAFKSGMVVTSGSVFGIMKEERETATNDAYGKVHIYANPYITLTDKNTFVGDNENAGKTYEDESFDGIACSLQDAMAKLDTIFFRYDLSARNRVADFYQTWNQKGMNWQFDNISEKPTSVDNSNLTFTSGTNAVCPVCKKSVTWKAVTQAAYGTTNLGALADGSHYYLAEDITYTGTADYFLRAPGTGKVACVHLNGHNLVATNTNAVTGYAGTVNVMGNGVVMGNNATENMGSAVHINTGGANGVVNLYGGTYTQPQRNTTAAVISIWSNGGKVNLYEGAVAKSNGSANAIYVHEATLVDAVLGIHGAKVYGGRVHMLAPDGKTSNLNISGNAYIEYLVLKSMYINVIMSGAPVVDTWAAAANNQIDIISLSEGADITINTRGLVTESNAKIAEYKKYFHQFTETDALVVNDNNELRYDLNYELYMTPFQRDVVAGAVADGKIHYYFMSSEKMVTSPTAEDNIYKWGDSCLIVFPNGETMLVDTGYSMQQPWLIGNLKRMGVTELDYLLITHPHSDHQGAFYSGVAFFDEIGVKQVLHNKLVVSNATTDDYVENVCAARNLPLTDLKKGAEMDFGDVHMQVLWPKPEMSTTSIGSGKINDTSMVFRLDYGEHSALFTADLYVEGEKNLMAAVDPAILDTDFLKVPHHGWNTSSSKDFVAAVSPELAVATSFLEMEEKTMQSYTATKTEVLLDVYDGYIHVSAGSDGVMETETSRER